MTPLELVGAYAAFANGGSGVIPYVIAQVKTADGKVIYRRQWRRARPRHRPDDGRDDERHDAQDLRDRHGAGRRRSPAGTLAGKTGTTQDYRDAWFVGFTGKLVAGVWLGNDDGELTKRVTGGNLPVEVWHRFMKMALDGQKPVPCPAALGLRLPSTDLADGETAAGAFAARRGGSRRQRLDAADAQER